ncbi:cellulase family glycosylhydrolase [Cellvibrio sp. pealriver]|uniref:cellulase family glycosylhydrolase n=1 Tax=Cellvibrio sp. pealriver TaxID=1622269 RepID=UPI000A45B34A|nr:cellulase family glycosylhydrolase [Cellvibrio sp. pealriver]
MTNHNILQPLFKTSLLGACIVGLISCGGGSDHGVRASTNLSSSTSSVASSSSSSSSVAPVAACTESDGEGMTMLKTDGTKWVKASGNQVCLKGTNLGNWLVQEFWMMGQGGNGVHDQCTLEAKLTERFGYEEKERLIKLFRDNWIKERDFDQLQAFGFNVIRLPILWSVIEDEKNPKTLRPDAWHYIDWTIAEAKKRGIYVILDLHGALGGQTPNDHTGCSGQNKYWSTPEYQERTKWLWEQIATRYKDEPAVAAFDPLNEPWGSTEADMVTRVTELYQVIRAIDDKHIVMLPSHYGSIEGYGNPAEKGMTNVAFELHPYPGLFGDRPNDSHFDIHRDWLKCGNDGKGGVCFWGTKLDALKTPMLMGEFQPWQGAGAGENDLGGKMGGITYDIYASYGWASTSWAYKLVSVAGGQGRGTWGMVTNEINTSLDTGVGLITKASTWDCNNWNSTFAEACAKKAPTIKVNGTGSKTYYLVVKTGANGGANPDVTYDSISLKNTATNEEVLVNGGFGSGSGWTELSISGSLNYNYSAADATKAPTGSEGSFLHITRPDGVSGEINGAVYQQITLQAGQSYTFSGTFKGNTSVNTWAEIYLIEDAPVAGKDVVDNAGKVDFTTAPVEAIEALFKSYGEVGYDVNAGLAKWLVTDEHNDVFDYPERPTNLSLTLTGTNAALTWNPVAGNGITYNVYRATSAGAKGTLVAEGLTATSFNDSGLNPDETYYYSIAAKNSIAEGYTSAQANTPLLYVPVPAKIEAEKFTAMNGIQTEASGDIGGGTNVGHFEAGDYIEFKIKAESDGNYTIDYRLASQTGSTGFEVLIDDVVVDTMDLEATGGWQTYITKTGKSFAMTAGNHTLRFRSIGKEWNLNWFEIKKQ